MPPMCTCQMEGATAPQTSKFAAKVTIEGKPFEVEPNEVRAAITAHT